MIVVEGFDASGKSTLAKRIGDELGWPVYHTGGPTKDEADVIRCLIRSETRMLMRCVQDRITHVSEAVYSMSTYPLKASHAFFAFRRIPRDITFIYCRPPVDTIAESFRNSHKRERWDTDEHLKTITRDALQLIMLYDVVVAAVATRLDVVRFDHTIAGSTDGILKLVKEKYS